MRQLQRFRQLVHHSYNIRSLEIISTSTNSQEGQTYVALFCGISDLEGNTTGVSISIDMVKTGLLVLSTEQVVQDSLRQSLCSGENWSAPE